MCLQCFVAVGCAAGRGGHPVCKKTERWGAGVVICLERGTDLHMAQLMPLPLTVSCFGKIQIGFTFLVPAHLGSPGKGPLNGCVCFCVCVCVCVPVAVSWPVALRAHRCTQHTDRQTDACYAQFTPPARRDKTVLSVSCLACRCELAFMQTIYAPVVIVI